MKTEFKNNYQELLSAYLSCIKYISSVSHVARIELCRQRALSTGVAGRDEVLQDIGLEIFAGTDSEVITKKLEKEAFDYHWDDVIKDFERLKNGK